MKQFKAALLISALLLSWAVSGYADRLYTWTDAKGVTHITQDPPPATATAVDTIDYSPQPNQPVHRSTESDQSNQQEGNVNHGSGKPGSPSGGELEAGGEENDVQYQYGDRAYWRALKRYEIKHKLLDGNSPEKGGGLPVRVQPRSGKNSRGNVSTK